MNDFEDLGLLVSEDEYFHIMNTPEVAYFRNAPDDWIKRGKVGHKGVVLIKGKILVGFYLCIDFRMSGIRTEIKCDNVKSWLHKQADDYMKNGTGLIDLPYTDRRVDKEVGATKIERVVQLESVEGWRVGGPLRYRKGNNDFNINLHAHYYEPFRHTISLDEFEAASPYGPAPQPPKMKYIYGFNQGIFALYVPVPPSPTSER